jgi:ABC-2 type transport system ATP-binding protein
MMIPARIVLAAAVAAVFLAGCEVGPNYKEPTVAMPDNWSAASGSGVTTGPADVARWWTAFGDSTLTGLIGRAVQANHDLRIAEARLRQSRAQRAFAAAGLWPTLDASAGYTDQRISGHTTIGGLASGSQGAGAAAPPGGGGSGFPLESNLYQVGFDASWELDVFGGKRRALEAASADVAASQEARRDTLVTLLAEVARNYVELRGLQQRLGVARQTVQAQQQVVEITRDRFRGAIAGELDVAQASALLASTQSQVPPLESAVKQTIHQLSVLLGRPPEALTEELSAPTAVPGRPPAVPVGLPSDLLRRRPDVRRAERQLAEATAQIGVQVAELFPKFSLTGAAGLQSSTAGNLFTFDSRDWSFGPTATWRIFDAGRVRANIHLQNARQEEALAVYEKTVLIALQDVENALVAYAREQDRYRMLQVETQSDRRALEIANDLYLQGLGSFLDVLDSERALYQAQDQLVQSDQALAGNLIALYKALGGGWENFDATGLARPVRRRAAKVGIMSTPDRDLAARAAPTAGPILLGRDLHKTFRRETGETVQALDGVSLEAGRGRLTALVGPDGAGKTTLLRLAAGLMTADAGTLTVLGLNVAHAAPEVQARIGYMPQRFGLYEDLTTQENLDLYADMHGVTAEDRRQRYERLMHMTDLEPFTNRLAGRLSGGMKQKLGLACTLIRQPELLLLDEPTVGIDPLSRRELWRIILELVREQGLSVLCSTSYVDEAEHCDHVIVLHQGRVLAQGVPADVSARAAGRTFLARPAAGRTARGLQARLLEVPDIVDAVPEGGQVRVVQGRAGPPQLPAGLAEAVVPVQERFEDGFMILLRGAGDQAGPAPHLAPMAPPKPSQAETVVRVHDLVRRFGDFTAVDHVSFEVRRGELFGLLGPNGAGKTTTFRMLCGLLPASGGTLTVAGVDLHHARASARQKIGYVAQKFSLYGQLTVTENLDFFASVYGLRGQRKRDRIGWALEQFGLGSFARLNSERLPGGCKQRLAMAAALLHEPEILFLDEPTSGADPLARREFWRRITTLAEQGVTVIVTTHFMEEAEYCDRVAIMDAGRILAQDTPEALRRRAQPRAGRPPTMEDSFIAIVEEARQSAPEQPAPAGGRT